MRRPPADLVALAGLVVVLAVLLAFVRVGRGAAAVLPVAPDSSAVVIVAANKTPLPLEVFFKHDGQYDRLGSCPAAQRCFYVLPSDRLAGVASFQLACLAHGETQPDDSPVYDRAPGETNITGCTVGAAQPQAAPSTSEVKT